MNSDSIVPSYHGYSANDIREFERVEAFARGGDPAPADDPAPAPAGDPAPADEPAPAPAPADDPAPAPADDPAPAPAWAAALQASIDKLTAATQRANVLFDDMGGEADRETKADAALGQYITGKKAGKK